MKEIVELYSGTEETRNVYINFVTLLLSIFEIKANENTRKGWGQFDFCSCDICDDTEEGVKNLRRVVIT